MQDSPFLLSSYSYELNPDQIAQTPVSPPESARLMKVSSDGGIQHGDFFQFPSFLTTESLVFLNDTKVLPARISQIFIIEYRGARKKKKGEILYLNMVSSDGLESPDAFEAMVYPGDSFPIGAQVILGDFIFEVREITYQGRIFQMVSPSSVMDMLIQYGVYPIPPYIEPSQEAQAQYQTEFAQNPGSLAAPTASLHFTKTLLSACQSFAKSEICYATLHVGIGTFKIINQNDIRDHFMHAETMLVPVDIFARIAQRKIAGKKIVAIGTTMVRYLESLLYLWPLLRDQPEFSQEVRSWWDAKSNTAFCDNSPTFARDEWFRVRSNFCEGVATAETSLFIYPGYRFGMVDEISTNFHLPNSTLMPMIAAFIGLDKLKELYELAKVEGYRFYSFGDGMYLQR